MSRRGGFLLCALPALSTVVLATNGGTPPPGGTSALEPANERGVPALFSLGDFDGDGRLDLAAVSGDGTLQLLANTGEGRFEDVTERLGLAEVKNAALALWADYDGDGRADLFVGVREGTSRLFHNDGSMFTDMSAGSGLLSEGAVQSAQWLDLDGDGRLDLFVVTAEKSALYRGLEGGFFERAELPGVVGVPTFASGPVALPGGPVAEQSGDRKASDDHPRSQPLGSARTSGGVLPLGPGPSISNVTPIVSFPIGCASSIKDQANPSTCLDASTTPALGKLYPISSNLFVAVGGNVGIGTTSPAAKLEVAGTARMTDTLTLNPSGDQALNVSTGSIYKGGALFIHTKGAIGNTALGRLALSSVTTGFLNTAIGEQALLYNTTGRYNTASGAGALRSNTTGSSNTASGQGALNWNTTGSSNTASGQAALVFNTTGYENTANGYGVLLSNTTGNANTASGVRALSFNTTGSHNTASGFEGLEHNTTGDYNTASGFRALYSNTTGARNIALGSYAGSNLTTGDDNITIGNTGVSGEGATIRIGTSGTHTGAFIAGIRGVTTGVADAIPVVVDSAGQLGTISSSRRFKKDIADMGKRTERLLELRPVVFHYEQEQRLPNGGEVPLEYGLIAEEVAEVFPELVVYDDEGKPFTVKYHLLSSMLLNELKKQASQVTELKGLLEDQGTRLAALEARASMVGTVSPTASR